MKFLSLFLVNLEDVLVRRILQIPGFHHGVRKIHRTVEDLRHGRDPNEPLRPGEATRDPNKPQVKLDVFFKHFTAELKNQALGRPTDLPPPPPPPRSSSSSSSSRGH